MRISALSSDVCSSDLTDREGPGRIPQRAWRGGRQDLQDQREDRRRLGALSSRRHGRARIPGPDSWAVGTGVGTGLSTTGGKSGPDPVFRTPHHGGMAMKRLQDKIAIITGGSGGNGKAVPEPVLGEGARVMLVDLEQDGLDATRQALRRE